jgi:pantetheine-phosphate adenylyltransferase
MKRKAIFPGTFDPFTIGHHSLVKRSLEIVDEIIIAIGVNDSKKHFFSVDQRLEMIRNLYKGNQRITVELYDCLTVDFAKQTGASLIVRGIRSINDFEYEKTIADMNRSISGIETIILFTEPVLTHISSTVVRELLTFGHNIDEFVPKGLNIENYLH